MGLPIPGLHDQDEDDHVPRSSDEVNLGDFMDLDDDDDADAALPSDDGMGMDLSPQEDGSDDDYEDFLSPDQIQAIAHEAQSVPVQPEPVRPRPRPEPSPRSDRSKNVKAFNVPASAESEADEERQLKMEEDVAESRAVRNLKARSSADNRQTRRSHVSKLNPTSAHDAAKKAKRYRIGTIVAIIMVLLFAVYQVFIPKPTLSESDVQSIAHQAVDNTGFPLQEGAGIAQQFMQVYLQIDGSTSANQMMNVFYNGMTYEGAASASDSATEYPNLTMPQDVKQKIQYGPYIYESTPLDAGGSTATYKAGALIYYLDSDGKPITDSNGAIKYQWVFYQVDLKYDAKTQRFTVFKDSPTRVSQPRMEQNSDNGDPLLPGNEEENEELETTRMADLIKQFLTAWASSDQTALSPLLSSKATPNTTEGLNGSVTLNGNPSYKIYNPLSSDPYYRALVTAEWTSQVTDQSIIKQQSTYVLKIEKDGSHLSIVDIIPYPWYPEVNKNNE
jgi:hypothetical protein